MANTKKVGIVTEIETMLAFVRLGYPVLIPYGDNERYDYAVEVNGKFVRIQAKHSITTNDGETFEFDCRGTFYKNGEWAHNQYTENEIDYFATSFNGKCYLFPPGVYTSKVKLRLLPTKRKGRQYDSVWAKDYELEKVVKTW